MVDWRLFDGNELLGDIDTVSYDQPWTIGRWAPTEAFSTFAPLFKKELQLLNADDMEEWPASYQAILDAGLTFVSSGGVPAAEWLLHIDGNKARFRWSREPF